MVTKTTMALKVNANIHYMSKCLWTPTLSCIPLLTQMCKYTHSMHRMAPCLMPGADLRGITPPNIELWSSGIVFSGMMVLHSKFLAWLAT